MQDEDTLEDISEVIRPEERFGVDDFEATWAFVATYHLVAPYGGGSAVSQHYKLFLLSLTFNVHACQLDFLANSL